MSRHRIGGWRIDVERREGVPRIVPAIALARAVGRALEGGRAPTPASIALILSDDRELAELNATHLGHEGPTDVLSFPLLPPDVFRSGAATPTFAAAHRGRRRRPTPRFGEQLDVELLVAVLHSEIVLVATYRRPLPGVSEIGIRFRIWRRNGRDVQTDPISDAGDATPRALRSRR